MRLTHFHLRHPEKDFAWIQITENPPLKLQKKWWMQRVTQIQQGVWTSESLSKLVPGHSDTLDLVEIVDVAGTRLLEQTVSAAQAMLLQAALEILNPDLVRPRIPGWREQFQPDGVKTEATQTKHPLEWHRKIAAPFRIFRGEAASKEDCHCIRIR
jgi:hypothetical protein